MAGDTKEGRPLLFKNKEELQIKIDEYFKECKENKKQIYLKGIGTPLEINDPLVPCIAGLAYFLGVNRETIYNYSSRDEFFDTIKKARDYILYRLENKLVNSNENVTGSIFVAKNYGYKDTQEIKQINTNYNHEIDYSKITEEEAKKALEDLNNELSNKV
jgi:hypothetical protein